MAKDFGVDVDCVDDHGLVFGLASGQRNLANALLRRLKTPRGGLFYDPDYGVDLREYLNATLTRGRIGEIIQAAESQCREDERVQEVTGTITKEGFPSVTAKLQLAVETVDGEEFNLVLPISELATGTSEAA